MNGWIDALHCTAPHYIASNGSTINSASLFFYFIFCIYISSHFFYLKYFSRLSFYFRYSFARIEYISSTKRFVLRSLSVCVCIFFVFTFGFSFPIILPSPVDIMTWTFAKGWIHCDAKDIFCHLLLLMLHILTYFARQSVSQGVCIWSGSLYSVHFLALPSRTKCK